MYMANKKDKFHPANRRGMFTLFEKSENTTRTSRRDSLRWLKWIFFCLLFVINSALPREALAANYYVSPNGSGNHDGSSVANAFSLSQAQSFATTKTNEKLTFLLASGNYGNVYFNQTEIRTGWNTGVTYKATPGETPVFTYLEITGSFDRYLEFDGIDVVVVEGLRPSLVYVQNSGHIHFKNMYIKGNGEKHLTPSGEETAQQWIGRGILIEATGSFKQRDILIEGCDISWVAKTIHSEFGSAQSGLVIRNNELHHFMMSCIGLGSGADIREEPILIEGNHIHSHVIVFHPGSGIAVRCKPVTIRNNIIHGGGGTSLLSFYHGLRDQRFPGVGFTNVTVENNLLYDPRNIVQALWFSGMGENFVFRNNTVISRWYKKESEPNNYFRRYGDAITCGGINTSTWRIYNNIFVGIVQFPDGIKEDYNIVWASWNESAFTGKNTKLLLKGGRYGNLTVDPDYFEKSGGFFVGGSDFDTYSYQPPYDYDGTAVHGQNLNEAYKLAPGSDAIGFAEPTQVPGIGAGNPYGVDLLGYPRDSQPDCGCYEYDAFKPGAPVLEPIGNQSIGENELLTFTVNATDPEGDPLTYSVERLPRGASFTNQTFSWTPTHTDAGQHRPTFMVSDGQNQDSETITITVGYAPVLSSIGNQSVTENNLLTFTITATDADNNPLTYSASNLPQGSSFDQATHTFEWTPTFTQLGSHSVTFTVSDGVYSDSETITITVGFKDTDLDGLPDNWEILYFGDLSQGPLDDPDLDGLSNLEEYRAGTDPTVFDELPPDLVLDMKFDDDPSDGVLDHSLYGNHGSCTGTSFPSLVPGKIGNAYDFDGIDDYIDCGNNDALSVEYLSVVFWIDADSWGNNAGIFSKGTTSNRQYWLWSYNGSIYSEIDRGGYNPLIDVPSTGIWHHLAITYDGSYVRLYQNGTEVGNYAQGTGPIVPSGYSFEIGRLPGFSYFNGKLDDFRVYNRALSAAEVLELYGEIPPPDTNAPVISNIDSSNISSSGATITWNTDENSTSQVEYGLDTTYGNVTNLDTSLVTSHSVALTGLSPGIMYHFRVKSADTSGNESISQDNTFTTAAVTTYIITASASGGGTISPRGTTQVVQGGSQTYTITQNTDHEISDVLVDGDSVGARSSYTFTNVSANHTIAAIFTYTITASAGPGGQINPHGITQVVPGGSQMYTITPSAGYQIDDVLVDGSSVGNVSSHNFTNVAADHTITAAFAIDEVDVTAPTVTNLSPQADSIQVPLNTLVTLDITDSGDGVDANSITIKVNGNVVYKGNTVKHSSAHGNCYRTGSKANYKFIYQSQQNFKFDQPISIDVNAMDLAGNPMDTYSYSFKTEMRSFGKNKRVDPQTLKKGRPATVCDSKGDIWATWHVGVTGSRDIYVAKLLAEEEYFGDSIKVTESTADQCNPVIATGSDNKLYVAWQDNRRGNWDIYVSIYDGINWSAEIRVTDSNENQINPAIVVDNSNNVHIVWEDDGYGNRDIYTAKSNNGFITTMIAQITSDSSDQFEPAIAVDSDNTVYVVWTDTRNGGKNDIYGAASNNSWTNIPVVTAEDSQSSPAIATEALGSILHLVWVDDRTTAGDDDIFYAKTNGGLPASPLAGSSIIDDTTGADQISPVIIATGYTENDLKVFACWRDERNADADLYAVEIGTGAGTNVFVGDDGTNTDQSEPSIGIDGYGYPYLVWTDERTDIRYAGSTFIRPDALASGNISTSSTVTVGTLPNAINSVDDVSAKVPQGAYLCDVKVTISPIKNPPKFGFDRFAGSYEFGPSGMDFIEPVTITIPYEVNGSENVSYKAYWYNTLTNTLSQQGITDVQTIVISSTLHALRFKTTHFSPFVLGGMVVGRAGGGGGGGCSMSPDSQVSIVELLLPYMGLTVAMVILKLRDRRKRKARNISRHEC